MVDNFFFKKKNLYANILHGLPKGPSNKYSSQTLHSGVVTMMESVKWKEQSTNWYSYPMRIMSQVKTRVVVEKI